MALEIFRLVGSIFVDNEQANQSISKTDEKAQGVGQTLLNGVKTAGKWGAVITAGASAAAAGCAKLVASSAAAADTIDKMSAKIGLSKQGYQEWAYVMGQNGMDVDKLQTGIKTLVTQMDSAANGGSNAAAVFDALGLSIYDMDGTLKDQETMMTEALYALADMENGAEKAALANQLFGKSGSEMMPMLNQGSQGMKDLTKRAHELGLVMSDEAVSAGVVLGDTIDDVKRSFTAIVTKLGASFFPAIQKVADYIVECLPTIEGLFVRLEPVVGQLFDQLLPPLLSLAEQVFPVLFDLLSAIIPPVSQTVETLLPVLTNLLSMLLPPIIEIVQQLLPTLLDLLLPLLELLSPILDLLQPVLDLVVGILSPLSQLISGLLTPLVKIISRLIQVALIPLKLQFSLVAGTIKNVFIAVIDSVMSKVNMVKGVFSGWIQFIKGVFTGDWKSAWEGVKRVFTSILDGIKNAFTVPFNFIIDGINTFVKGLNKIKIPDWVPGVGGNGFNIKEIPRLARGGVLEKGQTGFLEGNGAEAVVPLENNRAWTRAVARDMDSALGGESSRRIEAVLYDILAAIERLLSMGIYLDTEVLVGGLARPMDRKLGQIAAQKARA